MKKTQITLALNALALAGMLVFSAQAANAAGQTQDPSADMPQQETAKNAPSVDTDTTEVADKTDVDNATEVADTDVGDVDIQDVDELDSVSEMDGPDAPESN